MLTRAAAFRIPACLLARIIRMRPVALAPIAGIACFSAACQYDAYSGDLDDDVGRSAEPIDEMYNTGSIRRDQSYPAPGWDTDVVEPGGAGGDVDYFNSTSSGRLR